MKDTSVNTGTCGDSATYSLDDAGNLTISGNGAISDYVAGENPFANSAPIKKVIIEEVANVEAVDVIVVHS